MLIFKSQVLSPYIIPYVGKEGKELNHTRAAFRMKNKAFLKPAAEQFPISFPGLAGAPVHSA